MNPRFRTVLGDRWPMLISSIEIDPCPGRRSCNNESIKVLLPLGRESVVSHGGRSVSD